MKINCKSCGKRFDHEKHGGTCPKCGTVQTTSQYISSEPAAEKTVYTLEGSNKEAVTSPTYHKQPKTHTMQPASLNQSANSQRAQTKRTAKNHTKAKSEPRKKTNKVVTALLLMSMVLVVVVPIASTHIINLVKINKLTIKNVPKTEYYSVGEGIPFSEENVTITITDITTSKDVGIVAPEGYEFITFSYQVQDHSNVNTSYIPSEIYSGARIFLMTQSGCYLSPVSSYSIMEELGLNYDEGRELGISTHFEYPKGILYFLVAENDANSLLINYHDVDISSHHINEAELIRVIEIQNLEVSQ